MGNVKLVCKVCGQVVEKQCCACGNTKEFTKMPTLMVEETESTTPGAIQDTEARKFERGEDDG